MKTLSPHKIGGQFPSGNLGRVNHGQRSMVPIDFPKENAIGIVDLSYPENVRFARINGNYMMYAASLLKSRFCYPPWMPWKEGNLCRRQR